MEKEQNSLTVPSDIKSRVSFQQYDTALQLNIFHIADEIEVSEWIHQNRKAEARGVSRDAKQPSTSVYLLQFEKCINWDERQKRKKRQHCDIPEKDPYNLCEDRLCSHFVLLTPSIISSHLFQMLWLYWKNYTVTYLSCDCDCDYECAGWWQHPASASC